MITLIQISDCHLLKDKSKTGYEGIAPYHSLEAVLVSIAGLLSSPVNNPVIVLVTGDISGDHSKESYAHFLSLMRQYIEVHAVPWFVIAGNHDNNQHFNSMLNERVLADDAPLQVGKWFVHGCDTRHPLNRHGAMGFVKTDDMHAISKTCKQALQNGNETFHIVSLHHHVRPSHSWMDKHVLEKSERVELLVSQHSNIKALLHGHVHSPIRQRVGELGTPSFGCPSTCWQWAMQDAFGTSNEAPGYQCVALGDDGTVHVEVKRVMYDKHSE